MRDQAPPASTLSEPEIQIRQRAAAFVCIGMPALIYFGIVAAVDREWLLAILALLTAIVIAICALMLWRKRQGYRAIRPAVVCYTALVLYLVAYSGPEHARGL